MVQGLSSDGHSPMESLEEIKQGDRDILRLRHVKEVNLYRVDYYPLYRSFLSKSQEEALEKFNKAKYHYQNGGLYGNKSVELNW